MSFCARHASLLDDALELRGLSCVAAGAGRFDPVAYARELIITHATHFAGKAAVAMLTGRVGKPCCPLCFVNGNPAHINLDDWVNNAADDALAEDLARRDAAPAPIPVLT